MGKNKRGFTLAELLVAIIIMGILAAIAIPRFFPQKEKAIVAEAITMLLAIRQGELSYKIDNGTYCSVTEASSSVETDWNKIGLGAPDQKNFLYSVEVNAVDPTQSKAVAKRAASARDAYKNKYIKLFLLTGKWDEDGSTHPLKPEN